MVRAVTTHQCGPGSNPTRCTVSGFVVVSSLVLKILLLVLHFSSLYKFKQSLEKSSSILEQWMKNPSLGCDNASSYYKFLYIRIYFILKVTHPFEGLKNMVTTSG